MKTEILLISTLRFTKKHRKGICSKRVTEIQQQIEQGKDMYPIQVYCLGDGTYVVKDGRHRIAATQAAGIDRIEATIK